MLKLINKYGFKIIFVFYKNLSIKQWKYVLIHFEKNMYSRYKKSPFYTKETYARDMTTVSCVQKNEDQMKHFQKKCND